MSAICQSHLSRTIEALELNEDCLGPRSWLRLELLTHALLDWYRYQSGGLRSTRSADSVRRKWRWSAQRDRE